ncbi:MAG: hypothetical protein IKP60_05235 [Treponema sp.]|nr:hypothetical protein [Treponema sp.]
MKIRLKKNLPVFLSFVAILYIVAVSGCGLDNYYYLDMPRSDGHTAILTSSEDIKNYFSFVTNEESSTGNNDDYFNSSSDFIFLGTEVYYKIYSSQSAMTSVQSSVSSMVSNTSTYTSASDYLIFTKGYKALTIDQGVLDPLIKSGSGPSNRHVYIRLCDWGDLQDYQDGICVGTSAITNWSDSDALKVDGQAVHPWRTGSLGGFEFSKSANPSCPVPKNGDPDVDTSSGAAEGGVWYVDMYAVSVGRDTTYTESYSQPLFLGAVKIVEVD